MAWDASTSAAVAALVVAGIALIIAAAQVIQQYYVTGQLIRICDSVVFGPLPGQGRRVWQISQFRFRVIYSIPQICLDPILWPADPPSTKSYAVGQYGLPFLGRPDGMDVWSGKVSIDVPSPQMSLDSLPYSQPRRRRRRHSSRERTEPGPSRLPNLSSPGYTVGEAAWVSFCRAVEERSGDSMRFDLVDQDADRCPQDLVSAPMQVSMRDVVIMGLMSGMRVTDCSFRNQSLSMQGHAGTITSSKHPVLGPILHFTPRHAQAPYFGAFGVTRASYRGKVEPRWLSRTWNVCSVAQRYFDSGDRRTARRLDEWWLSRYKNSPYNEVAAMGTKPSRATNQAQTRTNTDQDNITTTDTLQNNHDQSMRRAGDGDWDISLPPEPEKTQNLNNEAVPTQNNTPRSRRPSARSTTHRTEPQRGIHILHPNRQATVEDAEEGDETGQPHRDTSTNSRNLSSGMTPQLRDRLDVARSRQAARSARAREIENDRQVVQDSIQRGAMPTSSNRLMIGWHPPDRHSGTDVQRPPTPPAMTEAEQDARGREDERQRLRRERDEERQKRNDARNRALLLKQVDFFWYSQVDIYQGLWATPWNTESQMPLNTSLVGAVTVILEALLGFLDQSSLLYTDDTPMCLASYHTAARWMFRGKTTYPAYGLNARGGVMAAGYYTGVRLPTLFKSVVPALELVGSYEWQVEPELHDPVRYGESQNVELMRIDSWLSYVGRTPEISGGRNKLLKHTPALVNMLMEEFELDFQNIDLSANEGGLQDIQGLAANVADFMTDEGLGDVEQLYLLVALLRAIKVCQCIAAGPSTVGLYDILMQDVQAHMV